MNHNKNRTIFHNAIRAEMDADHRKINCMWLSEV